MSIVDDERVAAELIGRLERVEPARRRPPGPRWKGRAGVLALVALAVVFVAVQPRGTERAVTGHAVPTGARPLQPSPWGVRAMQAALGQVGARFVWGGASPSGFDPSGLVVWAYEQAGRPGLPHYSGALWNAGLRVPEARLRQGDLLFFSGLTHVGIYAGDGVFVHATPPRVRVTALTGVWRKHYDGAVRIEAPSSSRSPVVITQVRALDRGSPPRVLRRTGRTNILVSAPPRFEVTVANGSPPALRCVTIGVRIGASGDQARACIRPGGVARVTLPAPARPRFGLSLRLTVEAVALRVVVARSYTIAYRIR